MKNPLRDGLLLVALTIGPMIGADSTVTGIYPAINRSDQASLAEAARRAQAEAGWWFARHADLSREFSGFRGYFIKVRDIGSVSDRFGIGAIVTGKSWDRTRAPSFAISFDPGGPDSQFISVENLAYLGAEWHPDYLKIREQLIASSPSAGPAPSPGLFGIDRRRDDYVDLVASSAISRAGQWLPANRGPEFAGFRGFFIKVRAGAGGVDDNFNIGAIVKGNEWDGTATPHFQRHRDPGGPEGQWVDAVNLTFLGLEWHPDFEQLHQHLRARSQ